jgi:hypothetical protein
MSCPAPDPRALECLAATNTSHGNSRFTEYRRCPKAHHLRYERGLRPLPREPQEDEEPEEAIDYFKLGNLVHSCLQYVQLYSPEACNFEPVLAACDAEPLTVAECRRLLDPYFAVYGKGNAGWPEDAEIVAVEKEFKHTWLAPGGRELGSYSARLDTVLRIRGSITIADTKTRARGFSRHRDHYAQGLATNPQFLGQSWLAMLAYDLDEPPPVWVNAIIKTKIPSYDRLLVRFTREAVERWAEWQQAESARGFPLRVMNYSACAPEIGSRCWAFDYCHGSDESRARRFTTESPKP